jgi:hypothetical protein
MTVSENLHRVSEGGVEQFEMTSEVTVCTSDLSKYQAINNVLIEKLDKLVVVSLPDFSHKPDTLEQARYAQIAHDTRSYLLLYVSFKLYRQAIERERCFDK